MRVDVWLDTCIIVNSDQRSIIWLSVMAQHHTSGFKSEKKKDSCLWPKNLPCIINDIIDQRASITIGIIYKYYISRQVLRGFTNKNCRSLIKARKALLYIHIIRWHTTQSVPTDKTDRGLYIDTIEGCFRKYPEKITIQLDIQLNWNKTIIYIL